LLRHDKPTRFAGKFPFMVRNPTSESLNGCGGRSDRQLRGNRHAWAVRKHPKPSLSLPDPPSWINGKKEESESVHYGVNTIPGSSPTLTRLKDLALSLCKRCWLHLFPFPFLLFQFSNFKLMFHFIPLALRGDSLDLVVMCQRYAQKPPGTAQKDWKSCQ